MLAAGRHRAHRGLPAGHGDRREEGAHGAAGVATSRHRSRAASCGCSARSAGVRSRAFAMPAASSRAVTSPGGSAASASAMISPQLVVVREPRRRCRRTAGRSASSGRPRICAHSTAHSRSFWMPMNTWPPSPARERAVRGDGRGAGRRCAAAGGRRRRVVDRLGHPLAERVQHRDVEARCRGRSAPARTARPARR